MIHLKYPAIIVGAGLLTLCFKTSAQNSVRIPDPLQNLRPAEIQSLSNQASSFFSAAKPAITASAKSTVTISYQNYRVSFGTVVLAPGASQPSILTKWSEVSKVRDSLVINTFDGKRYPAKVSGVYPDHDLALLSVETPDFKLPHLDLSNSAVPRLGNFIMMSRPDGNVEGFGVVSVLARSLREGDRAYLGVMMDFATASKNGVTLKEVMPNSAAYNAGLIDGDIVLTIDNTAITGAMEMRNLLQRLDPGAEITIRYRRGKAEKETTVQLGSRDENKDARKVPAKRMNIMERMGTVPSRVRTNFPNVIQSDIPIQSDSTPKNPHDDYTNGCGGPVVDLDGKVVGIAIARGSRIKTYIIPASTIQTALATKPQSVSENLVRRDSRNSRTTRQNTAGNSRPGNISAEKNDRVGRLRLLLEEIEQNNLENDENLRKIKEVLRSLKKEDRGDR